jgi:hypothetical protein
VLTEENGYMYHSLLYAITLFDANPQQFVKFPCKLQAGYYEGDLYQNLTKGLSKSISIMCIIIDKKLFKLLEITIFRNEKTIKYKS